MRRAFLLLLLVLLAAGALAWLVRADAGYADGSTVPVEFDSMLAKVVATGATREEALARLDDAQLQARIPAVTVCARIAPEQKLRLVQAYRDLGEVVEALVSHDQASKLAEMEG